MVNISPVSFQATPKVSTPKTKENTKEHKMASTPTKRSMNPLKAQLLALAMLGATTLNSCVYDERGENLKDAEEIQNIVTPKDTTVAGKANSMAKAIQKPNTENPLGTSLRYIPRLGNAMSILPIISNIYYSSLSYTLNLNKITSPSFTTYSLPSIPTSPFSLAAAKEPSSKRSL